MYPQGSTQHSNAQKLPTNLDVVQRGRSNYLVGVAGTGCLPVTPVV